MRRSPYPMPWNGPVVGFGGAVADQRSLGDMGPGLATGPFPRDPKRPARAQTPHELPLQSPSGFDEQCLVDRFVTDPHGLIIGEVDLQPVADLLRAPTQHPGPVLAMRLVAAREPGRLRSRDHGAVRTGDRARQALLDILTQPRVGDQLRLLRTFRGHVGLPLRHQRPILPRPAPSGGVATQLTTDRARITTHRASDLANPSALSPQDRDLLPLSGTQVAARRAEVQVERWHASSVVEPPRADRLRHTRNPRGLLRQQPLRDRSPERHHDRPLEPRMPRRPQLRTNHSIRGLLTTTHHTPLSRGVATTS